MFSKYSTASYEIPEVDEVFVCMDALEKLKLSATDGWKCGFLPDMFMMHKVGFLVVFNNQAKEFYVEKHSEGRGRKASKFKRVLTEATDKVLPITDDDSNDKVVCYLDDTTRITANSYCFKLQRHERVKDEKIWRAVYFYSDLAWALKGYLKHFLRKNRVHKERPTVQDLYDLIVNVHKKIEEAVERRENV